MWLCFQQAALHIFNKHAKDLFATFCLLERIFNSQALYIINGNEIIITTFCISEKHNSGFVVLLLILQGNHKVELICHKWEEKVMCEKRVFCHEKNIPPFSCVFPLAVSTMMHIIHICYILHAPTLFSREFLFEVLKKFGILLHISILTISKYVHVTSAL